MPLGNSLLKNRRELVQRTLCHAAPKRRAAVSMKDYRRAHESGGKARSRVRMIRLTRSGNGGDFVLGELQGHLPACAIGFLKAFVSSHDALDEGVPDYVFVVELNERNAFHSTQHVDGF